MVKWPNRVPPNCFFEVDDFESDWVFRKPFDFIHGRALAGCVKDFPDVYGRIKNNLKPGGWVEMVDFPAELYSDDDSMEKAPNVAEWTRLQKEASAKFGKEMNIAHRHKQWMIDAGYKNVTEEVFKVCPTFLLLPSGAV